MISDALGRLNEQHIGGIDVASSTLDDVMLTLEEGDPGHAVPARLMSDGSLRFLAVLTALMQTPEADDTDGTAASEDVAGQRTVVIEELENGLHASQARHLVELVRDQVHRRRVRALATAHSPALLDAFRGDEHRSVVVCQRDDAGRSTLTPLVDLPGYLRVVAGGGLGRAAVEDRLRTVDEGSEAASLVDDILTGGL
jgi:predicted ATPase